MLPDTPVITLQGDGDMVTEGLHEILHAAARGEQFTALLFNNGVFGDTGGHLTATTVVGQRTKTSLEGRDPALHGYPFHIGRLLAQVDGAAYVARGAVNSAGMVARTQAHGPAGARVPAGRRRIHLRRGPDHVPDRLVRAHLGRSRSTSRRP